MLDRRSQIEHKVLSCVFQKDSSSICCFFDIRQSRHERDDRKMAERARERFPALETFDKVQLSPFKLLRAFLRLFFLENMPEFCTGAEVYDRKNYEGKL